MSIVYKRKGSPYFYVTKTRESTRTNNRKLAEEYARKALTERWRKDALGEDIHTWEELRADWLDAKSGKASYGHDSHVIEEFSALLARLEIVSLEDITSSVISEHARAIRGSRRAPATANRHLSVIRAMLRRAKSKEWIASVPQIPTYQVPRKEPKWLTIDQVNSILPHLPEWLADMAVMAVQTGMRFSNVAGLKWSWISRDGSVVIVPAVHTKTSRTYTIPLSELAKKILAKRLEFQRLSSGPFKDYVFVGECRSNSDHTLRELMAPIKHHHTWRLWDTATEKVGLGGYRWHDLRHTWASLMTQNGVPDRVLAAAGGWSSTRMLDVYAHLAPSHLIEYVERVNGK